MEIKQSRRRSVIEALSPLAGVALRKNYANDGGMNWIVTAVFIIGDMVGGGLVALPTAMIETDFWPGLALSLLMTAIATYTSCLLGRSWVILQRKWPEYRTHCRKPYPEMGYRALGSRFKTLVSICVDVTQFGISVVYLLLASKNVHDALKAFLDVQVSTCGVILIMAVLLLPITMLKSPQDLWFAAVLAVFTTFVAVILIIIGSILDYGTCHPHSKLNDEPRFTSYFMALGTFLFSYGGHAAFPTIQHDMRKPYHFTRSSVAAFTAVTAMYLPVSIMGYVTYGNSLQDSIINSIQIEWIQQTVNVFVTFHCIITLTIVFNPLNQDIEEIFGISHDFGWQRMAVRTGVMVAVVFVAETLPSFGPLLDLVGGSTIALTAVILPCLFYLYLSAQEDPNHEKAERPATLIEVIKRTPIRRLLVCCFVILFGFLGGAATTYSATKELAVTHFTAPCYVSAFLWNETASKTLFGHTNCCGAFQNISRPGIQCNEYRNFYNQ